MDCFEGINGKEEYCRELEIPTMFSQEKWRKKIFDIHHDKTRKCRCAVFLAVLLLERFQSNAGRILPLVKCCILEKTPALVMEDTG